LETVYGRAHYESAALLLVRLGQVTDGFYDLNPGILIYVDGGRVFWAVGGVNKNKA
jgi:hypothetical protein